MADSARTALSHMEDQETDQIESYHPEWDPSDGKYVPWPPAFKFCRFERLFSPGRSVWVIMRCTEVC